jgi:hypothetical protein
MLQQVDRLFVAPKDPDIPIWRYMDFTRYVAMLEEQGVFFARVDQLNDRFEGSIPEPSAQQYAEVQRELRDAGVRLNGEQRLPYRELLRRVRPWVLVSSWHQNEQESAAMWALYGHSENAIAVRSTYGKLRAAMEAARERIYLGTVRYISYEDDEIPLEHVLWPFVSKRKSFEHERELRALMLDEPRALAGDAPPPAGGAWVKTPLAELIDAVYVAPDAEPWVRELVERVSRRYGMQKPVRQSALDKDPLF